MLYVNNPVILEIAVDTSGQQHSIRRMKHIVLLMVNDCHKETEKSIDFSCVWSNSSVLQTKAVVSSCSLQPTALLSRVRSGVF
jgi:hypothetical protein